MSSYEDFEDQWSFPVSPTLVGTSGSNSINVRSTSLLIMLVDVGQGECTILIERAGTTPIWCCIIDGGYGLPGRGAIARYLAVFDVKTIDAMLCTHFDGDHTKGLAEYLQHHAVTSPEECGDGRARVLRLIVRNSNRQQSKSSTKLKLLAAAGRVNTTLVQAAVGQLDVGDRQLTRLNCIHADSSDLTDENDGSIALRLEFGRFSYYTAGDLPILRELGILESIGTIDAFKCGHHGSANSTPPELISTCTPLAAFVSAGRNSFGHPTYDVVERLGVSGSSITGFYLTNCIHNRRLVNPNYDDDELLSVLPDYFQLPGMEDFEAKHFSTPEDRYVYKLDDIREQLDIYDNLASTATSDEAKRAASHTRKVFRALERAAEHERKTGLREDLVGHVAGSESHLGTIVIHVPMLGDSYHEEPHFHVGLIEETPEDDPLFVWYRHQRGSTKTARVDEVEDYEYEEDLEDLEDRLMRVMGPPKVDIHKVQEEFQSVLRATEGMDTNSYFEFIRQRIEENLRSERESSSGISAMSVPSSPSHYTQHVELRYEGYRKFTVPTVVGLSQSKTEAVYVPFCMLCYTDFDEEATDFEFVSVDVVDEGSAISMHRVCFANLFARLKKIKRHDEGETVALTAEDAYDLHEFVITSPEDKYNWGYSASWWGQGCRARFRDALARTPKGSEEANAEHLARVIAAMILPK